MLLFIRRAIGDRAYVAVLAKCARREAALVMKDKLSGEVFQFHEENRGLACNRTALHRLLIFFLIGIPKVIAGLALFAKVALWLSVSIISFSILALFMFLIFYRSSVKTFVLGLD